MFLALVSHRPGSPDAIFSTASIVDPGVTVQTQLVNSCVTFSGLLKNKLLNPDRVSITEQGHIPTEVQLSEPVKFRGYLQEFKCRVAHMCKDDQRQLHYLSMSDITHATTLKLPA